MDIVSYKYKSDKINKADSGDLICELTKFMDKYLICPSNLFYTYLYNDLECFSKNNTLQIAFRVPGATRGGIVLSRVDNNKFILEKINFNYDVCFGEYGCYKEQLKEDVITYYNTILDFSNVILKNNI